MRTSLMCYALGGIMTFSLSSSASIFPVYSVSKNILQINGDCRLSLETYLNSPHNTILEPYHNNHIKFLPKYTNSNPSLKVVIKIEGCEAFNVGMGKNGYYEVKKS